jgi:phosphohistidine phosphatase SixA
MDTRPANPKLHPEHEIIPTPEKVLSSGALRSTPTVHQWILNLSRENLEGWQASYCEQ